MSSLRAIQSPIVYPSIVTLSQELHYVIILCVHFQNSMHNRDIPILYLENHHITDTNLLHCIVENLAA